MTNVPFAELRRTVVDDAASASWDELLGRARSMAEDWELATAGLRPEDAPAGPQDGDWSPWHPLTHVGVAVLLFVVVILRRIPDLLVFVTAARGVAPPLDGLRDVEADGRNGYQQIERVRVVLDTKQRMLRTLLNDMGRPFETVQRPVYGRAAVVRLGRERAVAFHLEGHAGRQDDQENDYRGVLYLPHSSLQY